MSSSTKPPIITGDATNVTALLCDAWGLDVTHPDTLDLIRALSSAFGAPLPSWTDDHLHRLQRWVLRQTHARRSVRDAIRHAHLYGLPTTPSPTDGEDVIVDLSTNGPSSVIQLAAALGWTNARTRSTLLQLVDLGAVVRVDPVLYALRPEPSDA